MQLKSFLNHASQTKAFNELLDTQAGSDVFDLKRFDFLDITK